MRQHSDLEETLIVLSDFIFLSRTLLWAARHLRSNTDHYQFRPMKGNPDS